MDFRGNKCVPGDAGPVFHAVASHGVVVVVVVVEVDVILLAVADGGGHEQEQEEEPPHRPIGSCHLHRAANVLFPPSTRFDSLALLSISLPLVPVVVKTTNNTNYSSHV